MARTRTSSGARDPTPQMRSRQTNARRHLRERGPERVLHLIHPENGASIAVARKLGAHWERNVQAGAPAAVYVSTR